MENQHQRMANGPQIVNKKSGIQPQALKQYNSIPKLIRNGQPSVPLIPLKQANNNTREPSFFNSSDVEQIQCNASQLIAKLDSLREIKTSDSPQKHKGGRNERELVMNSVKCLNSSIPLQCVAIQSCVEPFRKNKPTQNVKDLSQTQQASGFLVKSYEAKLNQLLEEQSVLVSEYNNKIQLLEQKLQILSVENSTLIEQNKLIFQQNCQLNEEIQNQKLTHQQNNEKISQLQIESLQEEIKQKQCEMNILITKIEEIMEINKFNETKVTEQQQKIEQLLNSRNNENDAYYTQIAIQKQAISELEKQVNQLVATEKQLRQQIEDQQYNTTKQIQLKQLEQSNVEQLQKTNLIQSNELQLISMKFDSQCLLLQEKELEIQELQKVNFQLKQQLLQSKPSQICQKTCDIEKEELNQQIWELEQIQSKKDLEIDNLTQQLKQVRREKAKLSMNLMTAGMANLMVVSQSQSQTPSNELNE